MSVNALGACTLFLKYVDAAVDRHAAGCDHMEARDACEVACMDTAVCVSRGNAAKAKSRAAFGRWQRSADAPVLLSLAWEESVQVICTSQCFHGEQMNTVKEMCCRRVMLQSVRVKLTHPGVMVMNFREFWTRHFRDLEDLAAMRRGVSDVVVEMGPGTTPSARVAVPLFRSFLETAVNVLDLEREFPEIQDKERTARGRVVSTRDAYDRACAAEEGAYRAFLGACGPDHFEDVLSNARDAASSRGSEPQLHYACLALLEAVGRCGWECPMDAVRDATAGHVATCWTLIRDEQDAALE